MAPRHDRTRPSLARAPRAAAARAAALGLALLLAAGCGGGSSSRSGASHPVGSVQPHPDGTGTYFVVDAHRGGAASSLGLSEMAWGRLVDVYDRDPATGVETLRFREMVVGRDLASDGATFELRDDPVTGVQELVVLHAFGSPGWDAAFPRLELGLQPVQDPGAGGLLTMVARNAALLVRFDDLLARDSVGAETLRIRTGLPAALPFEARVFPDRNHGDTLDRDGDGVAEHHPTRVVVDLSVSEFELALSQDPLSVNVVGLPEATAGNQPNAQLRVPSRVDLAAGQFDVLRNLSQHPVGTVGNGSVDLGSPTLDVVRAFRSGGGRLTPPDPDNGFLPDATPPRVVGSQPVTVTQVTPLDATGDQFLVDVAFDQPACLLVPEVGDVLELASGALGRVAQDAAPPPPGSAVVPGVRVRRLAGAPSAFVPGSGRALAPYEPAEGDAAACFVEFVPAPGSPPAADVLPGSSVVVRFSEAMEPARFEALSTFGVLRAPGAVADGLQQRVVGSVRASTDLAEVRFLPSLPLTHAAGGAEAYRVELGGAVTDLGGNALLDALAPVDFTLSPLAPPADTVGYALDFSSDDQDGDGGAEVRGQFLLDPAVGGLAPRGVTRFSAVADSNQPTYGITVPIAVGLTDPLSSFGGHLQHVYRYPDLGFDLFNEANYNLDVEGLNWSPASGLVSLDRFDEFQILLSHSRALPDEQPDATGVAPAFPASGLSSSYAANYLETPAVVHERPLGYVVDPLSQFTSSTGLTMVPWPMNRDRPDGELQTFTWRDTTLLGKGGANSGGVDLAILSILNGTPPPPPVYAGGEVPSIGLPLLMEFRCYPDDQAVGSNRLATAVTAFPAPSFRAYSTGGVDTVQQPHRIDPDNDPVAQGGFNPFSVPPGQGLPPTDNVVVPGQVDFVVRVSVVHSMWFDSGAASGVVDWVDPVVEPEPAAQPPGTSVTLAFRGADSVVESSPGSGAARDAANMEAYGEIRNGSASVTFFQGDAAWKDDVDDLDGARLVQFRATFVADAATGQRPRLQGLGLAAAR